MAIAILQCRITAAQRLRECARPAGLRVYGTVSEVVPVDSVAAVAAATVCCGGAEQAGGNQDGLMPPVTAPNGAQRRRRDRPKYKEVATMPGFDGTGPRGQGPMTGGARGFCNPAQAGYRPQYGYGYGYGRGFGRGGRGFGRGFGPGYGRGRFWGWGAYPVAGRVPSYGASYPMSDTQEVEMLRGEAESIKGALEQINQRISELEKKETQD